MKTKLSILALVLLAIVACNKASDTPDPVDNGGGGNNAAPATLTCEIDGVPFSATKIYVTRTWGSPGNYWAQFTLHALDENTNQKIGLHWYNTYSTVNEPFSDYDTVTNTCAYPANIRLLRDWGGVTYNLGSQTGSNNYFYAYYMNEYAGPGKYQYDTKSWTPTYPVTWKGNLHFEIDSTTMKLNGTFAFSGKFASSYNGTPYAGKDSVVVTNGVLTGLAPTAKCFCPNWGY